MMMMIRARSVALVAAFVILDGVLASSTAAAQPGQPAPATAKDAARERYAEGLKYADKAEAKHDPSLYEAAYLQFAQAYAIFPDDRILWNLAVSEVETKRYLEGMKHLREYDAHQHVLAHVGHPDRARFSSFFARAMKETGHVSIEAPSGSTVRIDGNDAGAPPLVTDVTPGKHVIDVQTRGGSKRKDVEAPAGQTVMVTFEAETPPVATPPPARTDDPPRSPERTPDKQEFWGWRSYVGLGALGAGAVGLVIGAGYKVDESHQDSMATDARANLPAGNSACAGGGSPYCQQMQGALLISKADAENASRAFITGGVLAGLGAALLVSAWIAPHRHHRDENERVSVVPTPGGVVVRGAF